MQVDLLQADELAIGYPGAPPLLQDASFGLQAGRALVVLGPNGSGKSTLLRCLLGLLRPLAGRVRVTGQDVHALAPLRRAALLAYVPQSGAGTFPFEVRELVLMGRSRHLRFLCDPDARDHAAVQAALERVGIGHLAGRRFDTLSGGERQLALLARALAQDAPCIVLDEPCASLDPGHQVAVLDALRDVLHKGCAVLMASHAPEHAWALGCAGATDRAAARGGPGARRVATGLGHAEPPVRHAHRSLDAGAGRCRRPARAACR